MQRFIVTNSDSGAGCLKASGIADKVVGLGHELAFGPAPLTIDPLDFFSARTALLAPDVEEWELDIDDRTATAWRTLAIDGKLADRIELWMDPNCNAQLQLIQIIDWLHGQADITGKLLVLHSDIPIGELAPDAITALKPNLQPIEGNHFELATSAWKAFRHPTPEPWFALLQRDDLQLLPHFRDAVVRMLGELPAVRTGLTDTQNRILKLISEGANSPRLLFSDSTMTAGRSVYGYWRHGQMLDELASCTVPSVLGLAEGPFTLALHDDKIRYDRYKRSVLALSDFGDALLRSLEDFAQHNRIDRWWGGTRLTNQALWRWNADAATLVGP